MRSAVRLRASAAGWSPTTARTPLPDGQAVENQRRAQLQVRGASGVLHEFEAAPAEHQRDRLECLRSLDPTEGRADQPSVGKRHRPACAVRGKPQRARDAAGTQEAEQGHQANGRQRSAEFRTACRSTLELRGALIKLAHQAWHEHRNHQQRRRQREPATGPAGIISVAISAGPNTCWAVTPMLNVARYVPRSGGGASA